MPTSDKNTIEPETIALRALEFILADSELQRNFLESSGMTAKAIHDSIQDKDFLAGVLDFLLGREDDLIKFCDANKIEHNEPSLVRSALQSTDKIEADV